MSSAVAEIRNEALLDRWFAHPASGIVHHDSSCCDEARHWFLAYARSMEIAAAQELEIRPPNWLSRRFEWGPSEWPIAWCEIARREVVDCGVFAALAREVFTAQGHQAHPAQVLLSYSPECTMHWKRLWSMGEREIDAGRLFPWIGERIVYHEVCLLELPGGEARFYDSTWGAWLHPHQKHGNGAILAARSECPRLLRWGNRTLSCGEWVDP